jgi:nucleotide-binding universal stress UspA family protein
MGQSIVCGITDSTPPAVVEVAADLGARLQRPLVLANVAPEPEPARFGSRRELERARHAAQRRGQELLARFEVPAVIGLRAESRVVSGLSVMGLLKIADTEDAELLVIGSSDRARLATAILGSASRAIAKAAPCPVVVVPPAAISDKGYARLPDDERRTVLCGVRADEGARRTLRFANDLSRRLENPLVAVLEPDASSYPHVLAELREGVKVRECGGALSFALQEAAKTEQAGLIVSGTPGAGPLRSLFSASAELLREAPAPVIVLPESAEIAPGTDHYELSAA